MKKILLFISLTVIILSDTIYTNKNTVLEEGITLSMDSKIPISGIFKKYYETGELALVLDYKEGRIDGVVKEYYKIGKIKTYANFKNGKLNGIIKAYYKTGILKEKALYENEKLIKTIAEYYKSGNLKKELTFEEKNLLYNIHDVFVHPDSYFKIDKNFDLETSKAACYDGSDEECLRLCLMYIKGIDPIKKYYVKAKIYAGNACKLKNIIGCRILNNVDEEAVKNILVNSCKDSNVTACKDFEVLKNKKYYLVDGKCSRCGSSHIGRYLYGLIVPTEEIDVQISRGYVRLGGCTIYKESPKHFCRECGANLYTHNAEKESETQNTLQEGMK